MKANHVLLLLLLPFLAHAQAQVKDGLYVWPSFDKLRNNSAATMLSGSTFDLDYLNISAQLLLPGKTNKVQAPGSEEQLLFVKNGILTITLRDSTYSLVKGSMAMMMPNENYVLQNLGTTTVEMQVMKYKSKLPVDRPRGQSSGGSFVKDWNKLTFQAHERGGVRSYFERPTANTKRFEMHVTTLKENFNSHDPHQHRAEEIILVLEGKVEMLIGEKLYQANAGDVFAEEIILVLEGKVEMLIGEKLYQANAGDVLFANSQVFHGLKNSGTGTCSYFAFQWE
jgi:(S)-ureidoglycine aminohydrolase